MQNSHIFLCYGGVQVGLCIILLCKYDINFQNFDQEVLIDNSLIIINILHPEVKTIINKIDSGFAKKLEIYFHLFDFLNNLFILQVLGKICFKKLHDEKWICLQQLPPIAIIFHKLFEFPCQVTYFLTDQTIENFIKSLFIHLIQLYCLNPNWDLS